MSPDDDARTLIEQPSQPAQPFPAPIPGIIPFGSICTFAGASGVGKTAMYAGWIRAWLDGGPICGHPTRRPTEIGLLIGDRRWQSHRQWLDAVGVPESMLKVYSLRDDETFPWNDLRLWPKVPGLFARCLDKLNLKPGALLISDPMALWLPGKVNDYKDVAIGLGVLDRVIQPRDLTMLGIFHQSKQLADKSQQYVRPQDKILGSAAQLGFSDTAMYLLGPEDVGEAYYGFGWVPHNALAETFKFSRDAWGLFIPYGDAVDAETLERVLDGVPYEPLSTLAIINALQQAYPDLAQRTIERKLNELLKQRRIVKVSRGVYKRVKPS